MQKFDFWSLCKMVIGAAFLIALFFVALSIFASL